MAVTSPSRGRLRLFAAIAVTGSLLIGLVLTEAAYRAYLYLVYVIQQNFAVTTVDVRPLNGLAEEPGSLYGYYQPNKPITFSSFDASGRLLQRHTTPINNYGWPSQNDWTRRPAPGEFRIAIVGDSMTASINNAKPWPDVMQRHLDADEQLKALLGAQRITVLNLGVAGASMQFMANPLAVVARRFSSDLVVVNFIADDLRRRHSRVFAPGEPSPQLEPEPAEPADVLPKTTVPDLVVDGVGVNLLGCKPRELTRPECQISPYFSVAPGVQLDQRGVNRIKRELGARIFWSRVAANPKPLLILDLLGRPAVRVPPRPSIRALLKGEEQPLSIISMRDATDPVETQRENVDIGAGAIRFIKSISKDLMVTHNPLFWYLTGEMHEPGADELAAALAPDGIAITRMAPYLPLSKGRDDWFKWFNLPHDGHWSDAGAEVYGEAMYRAVRDRLIATRRKPEGEAAGARPVPN